MNRIRIGLHLFITTKRYFQKIPRIQVKSFFFFVYVKCQKRQEQSLSTSQFCVGTFDFNLTSPRVEVWNLMLEFEEKKPELWY